MRIVIGIVFILSCLSVLGYAGLASPHRDVTLRMLSQNHSGENGSATLTDLNGRTRVVIHVLNENTTGNQPAHIHTGSCSKLNPAPKYPLKNVVLGTSNTIVDVPMSKLLGSRFAINVHESPNELTKYVSCGNIP
jgi:hypothetical protein